MTQPTQRQQYPTEADVRSLSQKLQELDKTLSPGEGLALRSLIVEAFDKQDDVRGFQYCTLQDEWWGLLDWTCFYWE